MTTPPQPKVELLLTDEKSGVAIRNLWSAYLHDISVHQGTKPNQYGVMSDDPDHRSCPGPGGWWNMPKDCFPYLILVDGKPAGFNLIATGSFASLEGIDFVIYEFFVAKAYRGTHAATEGARLGIERHAGAWEVVTYPTAARPIAFWRKALPPCADGEVTEAEEDHAWGRKVVFQFRHGREVAPANATG